MGAHAEVRDFERVLVGGHAGVPQVDHGHACGPVESFCFFPAGRSGSDLFAVICDGVAKVFESPVQAIQEMEGGSCYPLMAELMGYAGLRYGEAAGLYVGDLDFNRRLIEIQRQVTEVSKDENETLSSEYRRVGNLLWGQPKGEKTRIVPLPRHMAATRCTHTAGKRRGDLVFGAERGGKVIRGLGQTRRSSRIRRLPGA